MWKIYHIETGKIVQAGFDGEEEARDWLELNREGREDNYVCEEMDEDEEAEWTETGRLATDDEENEDVLELDRYNYTVEEDDGDESDDMLSEVSEDDDDF